MKFIKAALAIFTVVLSTIYYTTSNDNKVLQSIKKEEKLPQKSLADIQQSIRYNFHKELLSSALELYFKKAIDANYIVGAGVSITKGDSIVIAKGFGVRASDTDALVNEETVFRLGSLSKGFTGILAANMHSKGEINFNDNLIDYIPTFQLGDKKNTKSVKIAHILSHTSGVPYHSFTNLVEAGLPISKIAAAFSELQPISIPGEQYSYQNAMFALIQKVMYEATGNDIEYLLKRRFFEPLGMSTASTSSEELGSNNNVALPHRRKAKSWSRLRLTNRYDNAVAAGGINASALDMAKWMRFLLGKNPEVMHSNDFRWAFSPVISFKNKQKYYQRWKGHLASSYGYGWRIHSLKNQETGSTETVWHHGGSVNNFRNEIAVFPELDFGICVLLNSNSKIAKHVIPDVRALVKFVYSQSPPQLASL